MSDQIYNLKRAIVNKDSKVALPRNAVGITIVVEGRPDGLLEIVYYLMPEQEKHV